MRLIDISHPLNEKTPVFPADDPLTLRQYRTIEKNRYAAYYLQAGFHTGTHIDMPMHLLEGTRTVDTYPVDCFAGEGVLIDARGEDPIPMRPEYRDTVREGSIPLLLTGYDKQIYSDTYFENYPVITEELSAFFIERKIKMIGLDTPSPDRVPYGIHRALLRAGIFVLENLANLDALLGIESFEVFALPLKLPAEASFVRAVCRI